MMEKGQMAPKDYILEFIETLKIEIEELKNSKAQIETVFYEWLLEELPEEEKAAFCKTLDALYWRSKRERQAGFENVARRVREKTEEGSAE